MIWHKFKFGDPVIYKRNQRRKKIRATDRNLELLGE